MVKVGLITEGKVPIDKRVPLTPDQAVQLQNQFTDVMVVAQSSKIRCFTDENYRLAGIDVVEDVSDCDILLGVKEVPLDELISDKTYFFFSHTTKEQPYNQKLLQSIIEKRIRLIDYEGLTNYTGARVVAFGRYAGIVGAYNGIMTYGKRYDLFDLRAANICHDLDDLSTELLKVKLPNIKIALTGRGRVSKGAMEVLEGMNIVKVSPEDFINKKFDHPVYTQLISENYNIPVNRGVFDSNEFHNSPQKFEGDFLKYANVTDILIAGAFWDPDAPVLFTKEDVASSDFKIKVIADITCDIEGSIPSTLRPSTIDDPIYDYAPGSGKEEKAFSGEENITVMAVDNLPCELPINASNDFGRQLIDNVLPHLFTGDKDDVINRATITKGGKLTEKYSYLQDYLDGN
jgi:alanine dehydrogenase